MLSKNLFLAAVFAAFSQAFTVPEDLPNGVYVYSSNAAVAGITGSVDSDSAQAGTIQTLADYKSIQAGETVNSSSIARDVTHSPKFIPRGKAYPISACGKNYIGALDYGSALKIVDENCGNDNKFNKGNHIFGKYGDAVVFMCNYRDTNQCHDTQLYTSMAIVNTKCGKTLTSYRTGKVCTLEVLSKVN